MINIYTPVSNTLIWQVKRQPSHHMSGINTSSFWHEYLPKYNNHFFTSLCLSIFLCLADPCPPENIWVEEPEAGNCSVVWEEVPLVEYYMAFIKRDDGTEKSCNTTGTTCPFTCTCGYTYLTTVFPYNQAGSSPYAHVRNYTTSRSTSTPTSQPSWLISLRAKKCLFI